MQSFSQGKNKRTSKKEPHKTWRKGASVLPLLLYVGKMRAEGSGGETPQDVDTRFSKFSQILF